MASRGALGLASNLTYGSLISARCLGSGWRIGVEFDAVTMDQKYRAVTPHIMVLDHGHVAIVQREPIPVEPCRDNGVVFFPGSSAVYTTGMTGGFGVSGDGVDEDDVVTAGGIVGFGPPAILQADNYSVKGIRLPYQNFDRNPEEV